MITEARRAYIKKWKQGDHYKEQQREYNSRPEVAEARRIRERLHYRKPAIMAKQRTRKLEERCRRNYGMTLEQRSEFLSRNGGACEICNAAASKCVDHDHSNGKVRGGLCGRCNSAIGQFHENSELLKSAIRYLEKHKQ